MEITSSSSDFKNFCEQIVKNANYVAIDTEFVRTNTYFPKLCLLQLAFKEKEIKKTLIIDTYNQEIDFKPFLDLLKNNLITKVFHAGRQDCEIFFNEFECLPNNIFDTQIGAMICGIGDQESYEKLVFEFLGVKLNKSLQFTDWSKRPLSQSQIEYAKNDVYHLCEIFEMQKKTLDYLNRNEWIIEENQKLGDKNSYHHNSLSIYKKIKFNKNTKNKNLTLDLIDLRERIAKKINVPRNHVIKDQKLISITKQLPKNIEEIKKLNLFSNTDLGDYYNKTILKIIQNFEINNNKNKYDDYNINDNKINYKKLSEIINFLKILLNIKCNKYKIPTRIIASNKDLENFVLNNKADIPALKGWRRKIFGEDAIRLKNGKIALYYTNNGIELIEI